MTNETWKPVVGYEGLYEISDQGRVKSLPRWTRTSPTILRGLVTHGGRRQVFLSRENVATPTYVHRLVLTAFVSERPPGHECNHKNADPLDNRLCNLEWVTPQENMQHAVRNRLHRHGERHANAKLTDDAVREIRKLSMSASISELATQFGVGRTTISNVVNGLSWKHVA